MSIPAPNPPTDNLYKFIAIAGVVGVLLIPKYYLELAGEVYLSGQAVVAEANTFELAKAVLMFKWGGRALACLWVVSWAATVSGFLLWYSRVQRHADVILVRQANRAE